MTKVSQLFVALAAFCAMGLPAHADADHQHAAPAAQGGGPMDGKPGGCMHDEGMGMGHRGDMGMPMFTHVLIMQSEALKLTDEQVGKLHRIGMRHIKDTPGTADKMHDAMMKLHQTMMDPAADEAAIKKAAGDHTAAFQAMIDAAVAERNEALAVLTADQKKALKTLKADDTMMPGKMMHDKMMHDKMMPREPAAK